MCITIRKSCICQTHVKASKTCPRAHWCAVYTTHGRKLISSGKIENKKPHWNIDCIIQKRPTERESFRVNVPARIIQFIMILFRFSVPIRTILWLKKEATVIRKHNFIVPTTYVLCIQGVPPRYLHACCNFCVNEDNQIHFLIWLTMLKTTIIIFFF